MSKIKIFRVSVLIALILSILFSMSSFAFSCNEVRSSVLRLHILANSDSEEDQKLKLKVRDEVLKTGENAFYGAENLEEAEEKIETAKAEIQKTAERVIKENGYDYPIKISICREFFSTRTYNGEITLPAGEYMAVRIIIGEGNGKNWWCIMFPPLCVPPANGNTTIDEVLDSNGKELVESNPKYEVRFKIVEIYEKIYAKLK